MDWRHRDRIGIWLRMFALVWALNGAELSAQTGAPPEFRLSKSGQQLGEAADLAMDVVTGDVDGDGDADVLVAGLGMPTRIWINTGSGQFVAGPQSLGSNAVAVAWMPPGPTWAGRAVTLHDEANGTLMSWLRSDPQGFVAGETRENCGDLPSALALADLGGNSFPEVVMARFLGRPAQIWINPGNPMFAGEPIALESDSGSKVALGDLDRDGDVDVVLAEQALSVWLNPGRTASGFQGSFTPAGPAFGSGLFLGVALADLDGDGDLDAVTAESDPSHDRVWINQGGAQRGTPARFADSGQRLGPGTGQSRDVALGDLDRDGDIDAVVARPRGNLVYWNDGAGRFTEAGTKFGNGPSEAIALADFDLDGNLDVFVASFGAPAEVWLAEFPIPSAKVFEHDVDAWAGTGEFGSTGDGGPALAARFESPKDLAVDSAGVVYVVEGNPGRVRRIGVDRIVSTVLSGSEGAATGDGGPLSQATFGRIASVAVDGRGALYLAENSTHRIRRISPEGTVTTVAGTGVPGFHGDGGPAVAAQFNQPSVVRVDTAGNLYVVDRRNRLVRRVDTNGVVTTVAGNRGVGNDGDGGPAVAAAIGEPDDLVVGPDGNLFLSYQFEHRVRRVSPAGILSTVAGTGPSWLTGNGFPATTGTLNQPLGMVLDRNQNLLIGQYDSIRYVDEMGILATVAGGLTPFFGEGDGGSALRAVIQGPVEAMARLPDGTMLFTHGNRVRQLVPNIFRLPVVGRLDSFFSSVQSVDFGVIEQGSPQRWNPRHVPLRNSGNGDLTVRSIEWVGQPSAFRFSVEAPWHPAARPPYRLPASSTNEPLNIVIECIADIGVASTNNAVLRVTMDSPETPVREIPVQATVRPAPPKPPEQPVPRADSYFEVLEESWLSVIIGRIMNGNDNSESAGSVRRHDIWTEPQEFALRLDPARRQSVTTEVPEYLGGGSVTIDQFDGEVRFRTEPDPDDAGFLKLTVLQGQFTAPSFSLPSGIVCGPTTLTFADPALSSGRLNRATGEYTAKASASIINALFPGGLPVNGFYRGEYDAASGRASLRSFSFDRVPRTEGLQVIRDIDGAVVTWMSTAALESAPSVLGPWQPHTNAVSPYRLDLRDDGPRFYRLSGATNQ